MHWFRYLMVLLATITFLGACGKNRVQPGDNTPTTAPQDQSNLQWTTCVGQAGSPDFDACVQNLVNNGVGDLFYYGDDNYFQNNFGGSSWVPAGNGSYNPYNYDYSVSGYYDPYYY